MANVPYRQPKAADQQKELSIARQKLEDLKRICDEQHVRLVYLIVPTHQADDTALEPLVKTAAQEVGVQVSEPVGENEWALDQYSDGYHLTHMAAVRFSEIVGKRLADQTAQSHSSKTSGT